MAALDQRVTLRYPMPGLDLPETKAYVSHHLALAVLTELRKHLSKS
jgi:type II secretory pathway predicted ATPase ExeA